MGPKAPNAFQQNQKARCLGGTGERNEQTRRWVQKEKGELIVISPMGENDDEEQQWKRKRWVFLIEIFMYFGNAYILSWDEPTAFYTLLGTLITFECKQKSGKWKSQHIS